MGRIRRSRTHKSQRDIHRASRTRVRIILRLSIICTLRMNPHRIYAFQARTRDLDQIQLIDLDPKVRPSLTRVSVDEVNA